MSQPASGSKFRSPEYVANYFSKSESTINKWRHRGVGPDYLKIGGHIAYTDEAITAYEQSCLRHSTKAA